ncbi:NAD(P)/FAD-dependent oxidoreductase [Sphingomonas sp. 37zxx]|uniref:NAD(P)/FAD-dependent oxidoreductase n=1 Tax=Sphingomonas sp. 37zxx TaxID=1550073 RepID=UPI00053BF0F6|nr:FAD-binding oxidoreductase [Sphingomonas sp. 37zxx]
MTMQQRPTTAIVAGDGVIGLATGIALARRGVATTIVAPDGPWRGASWGNAGHIAIEQIEPLASRAAIRALPARLFQRGGALALPLRDIAAWLPFGLALIGASHPAKFAHGKAALSTILATALPAWRQLLDEAGAAHLLREDGHFIVWETARTAAHGRASWMNGDRGTASFRDATADELGALSALVKVPIAGAIRCIGSGQIADLAALGLALRAHFVALGGQFEPGMVQSLTSDAIGASAVIDGGREIRADVVVAAAGAASASLVTAPLIAERGYHVEGRAANWPANLPPVVFEDRAMIVTGFASALRAASFVEFARLDSPPDPRKWDRLRNHLTALGIQFCEPLRPWMGARPTLPDYLPAIGRCTDAPTIAYAFGHQHLGLTLAATTGDVLAATLCGEASNVDITSFNLSRFGH